MNPQNLPYVIEFFWRAPFAESREGTNGVVVRGHLWSEDGTGLRTQALAHAYVNGYVLATTTSATDADGRPFFIDTLVHEESVARAQGKAAPGRTAR